MSLQRRFFVGLLAGTLFIFQPALAQEEAPLILLDSQQEDQSSLRSPTADTEEPATESEAVPQIQLPPPASIESETTAAQESPVIPERDRGEGVMAPATQKLLVPLTPTSHLADIVQIGASQPMPGILRLTGEMVSVDLEIDLPEKAGIPSELALTLRSTVNVLPDVAAMTITINDAPSVVMPLEHLSGFETVAIPAAGLSPGMNRVRLDLRQPHRIYCGPEASFGVWTEIHLTQSGVPVDVGDIAADPAGFALALHAQAATGRAVPVLVAQEEDAAVLRQLAEMLNRLSNGRALIEFDSFYSLKPPSPFSIALIRSNRSHAELREGAAGGLVLQVEHADGQLPLLDDLLPELPPFSSSSAPALSPGTMTSLQELGQQDIIGRTRYFRHEVPFDLPKDWLLLSNQKARLQLRYGFANALPEGAILLVKANNETIRLLPLDRDGGQMQEPLDVVFSANLLHPGRNSLAFEMMVPGNPPDVSCPPRRVDILVVSSDSMLLVPPAPAMTLAGISKPLSGLGSGGITVPSGVLDQARLERVAAEMSAGLPAVGAVDPSVRLNVISIGDIPVLPLEHLDVSGRDLQEALISTGSPPAPGASTTSTAPARRYQLTDNPPETAEQPSPEADRSDNAEAAGRLGLKGWLDGHVARLKSASFIGSDQSLSDWFGMQHGSAILFRPNPHEPNDLWLVLGPQVSAQSMLKGLVQLRDNGLANGEAAVMTANGTWEVWSPVRPPELRESLTLTNLPAVLGNYASWSPLLFTIAILAMALLSAIPALLFILFTRRRGQL